MKEKNSISIIDFIIVFIVLFYMEYRICIDLLKICGLSELNSAYFVISIIFLTALALFEFYINKYKKHNINYKKYVKELFTAVLYCAMHVLLLEGFISSLNYFYLLILQLILALVIIIFTFFLNHESKFNLNRYFIFVAIYIVFVILTSSVTALLLYE